jgi:hypothetical protein
MSALRTLPHVGPRHAYDFDPTPGRPVVRLFPAIKWLKKGPCWVRDVGEDIEMPVVGPFTKGHQHACDGLPIKTGNLNIDICNVCKQRPSTGFDDFFGYTCNLCNITHRLRYKARDVNPWSGKVNP